jgi:hypothetical protein
MVIGKSGSNQLHGSLLNSSATKPQCAQRSLSPARLRNFAAISMARRWAAIQNTRLSSSRTGKARLRTGITRFSGSHLAQRIFTQAAWPASRRASVFPTTVPANASIHRSLSPALSHAECSGANNYVRTATEPTSDQADFRLIAISRSIAPGLRPRR